MAGKSCSASGCAGTSARTSACERGRPLPQRLRPHGTCDGGREKAPAAICRKVIEPSCRAHESIEIWGDGEQTRSFMYIDDCVHGTQAILESDILEPINLGSSEMVTINQLVDIVEGSQG